MIVILIIRLRIILLVIRLRSILAIRLGSMQLIIAGFIRRGGPLPDASFSRDQTWQIVLIFVVIRREQGNWPPVELRRDWL
jgi:hypothetical protein